jgi:hypothetical protein
LGIEAEVHRERHTAHHGGNTRAIAYSIHVFPSTPKQLIRSQKLPHFG